MVIKFEKTTFQCVFLRACFEHAFYVFLNTFFNKSDYTVFSLFQKLRVFSHSTWKKSRFRDFYTLLMKNTHFHFKKKVSFSTFKRKTRMNSNFVRWKHWARFSRQVYNWKKSSFSCFLKHCCRFFYVFSLIVRNVRKNEFTLLFSAWSVKLRACFEAQKLQIWRFLKNLKSDAVFEVTIYRYFDDEIINLATNVANVKISM